MAKKIKYGIYPNPSPDADGNTTYQVRSETFYTVDTNMFLEHLRHHQKFNTNMMQAALNVLSEEILEHLMDNLRFRINGLGTFQIRVGLKSVTDEEGRSVKPHITDPATITANDVEITGISFTPDLNIIRRLQKETSLERISQRGKVGHSTNYSREEIVNFLDDYLSKHDFITRHSFQILLKLTRYSAEKWLDRLTTEVAPRYVGCKEGNTIVYRKKGQ